jgi:hypothetical protein
VTLNYQDAFYHVQEHNPGIDVGEVLDGLKKQDRVKFNDSNQVYTYEVSGRGRVGGCSCSPLVVQPSSSFLSVELGEAALSASPSDRTRPTIHDWRSLAYTSPRSSSGHRRTCAATSVCTRVP